MTSNDQLISATRIKLLRAQGYCNQSDAEISGLAFGNRFAYIVCTSVVAVGVATAHIPTLAVMMVVALGGVVLPYHPVDYIYNHVLRGMLNKPELPPRSKQLKFACIIATLWLGATIYMFYAGHVMAGYVLGWLLVAVAGTVATTDFCIPSFIYNLIFRK